MIKTTIKWMAVELDRLPPLLKAAAWLHLVISGMALMVAIVVKVLLLGV